MRNLIQGIKSPSAFAGALACHVRQRLRSLAANRNSIGLRLLVGVLLFSGAVTIILTAIQLYVDYRRETSAIELQFNRIGASYTDSLAESLWNLDEKQLRLQLEGILRLPDIRVVEVREAGSAENPLSVRLSRDPGKSDLVRDYPLRYKAVGQDRVIGSFHLEATLAGIYWRLERTALAILVTQAAQTFLVSLFILYMFHHLVTRHLSAIAADVGSYRIEDSPRQLQLRRRPPRHEDELQQVVTAFNALYHNLHTAYRNLADREVKIRRLVDANVIGIFISDIEGRISEANDAFLRIVGYEREDLLAGRLRWAELTPPEWQNQGARALEELAVTGTALPYEKEYFRKDGSRVPVLIGVASLEEGGNKGVAFVLDLTERKLAEKALRESEKRFRALMQFSFDVYWETDAQHRFIRQDYSEQVTDGPSPGSELGKRRWELPYLDIDEEGWRKHRETLDAHLPFRDLEYARPTPQGGKRYAAVSGLPMFDEAGRFTGYRGVARHITERKQIEEALRQREKELREIVETIPAMTVTITADGRDAFIGKRFSEYSGLSEEDARGSGWKVTVHPDDLDLYLRNWRPSLISGDPIEFETRVRRADGEYRWFLARAVAQKDEHGNILKWYEVLTDIEDRKRAEAVLRERESRIRRLFDANIIGILISDFEGRVVEANDAFLGIVGYGRDDLIAGRINLGDMTPPEWRELQERSVEEMNSSGTMPSREKEYFRKDGSRVPVLVGGAGLEEGGKQSVGFVLDLTERKRAEAVLRESEARVRHLIDANIIGIFIGDFDGNIVDANDTYLRLLGYDREDLLAGRINWVNITPPELLYRSERALQEMKSVGKAQLYEKEYIRKDGSRVPALVGATIFGEGRGLGFVIDLTEQKRAEAALRQRDATVRSLVDANIIGTFTWRLDKAGGTGFRPVFQDVNDAFLRIVGYDREDLATGTSTWILTPPDWVDRTQRAADELQLNGAFQPYEKVFIRKDGSRVPVMVGAAQTGDTGIAFVLDLTDQKRVEAALRESEEQWKAVFENNPVMHFMVGETGTILSVNPFGAEQLGYSVDELVGRPVTIVFYETDREVVQKNAAVCFERPGRAMSWELRKVRKNGEMIWVRETARATLINDRPVLLIVCEDITEGKRAAETLREVQMELAHANRVAALGQLTGSIAHEVNQPIAAAHNNANAALNFLDSRPADLEELREALYCIVSDTERAGEVIEQIRALVKKTPPRKESLDMNEAIRDVIVITRGEAAKNDIAVEAQLAEGLGPILGDRVQLQQVILNLIINAIEAMTGVAGPRELLIKTAKCESDGVLVAIQDNGPGLAPEILHRAFEAFYTTKPDGLGIGLSICRSIVEAHGGRLLVGANVPRGAIFQFTVLAGRRS